MEEVDVQPVSLDQLATVLSPDRVARLDASAVRARACFGDRVVWHVNATAHGGGVAEMLQTLLAYGKGAGIENRWLVLDGDLNFFRITKRLHNLLHGSPGDKGSLGREEHSHYQAVLGDNLEQLERRVSPGDIVMLHDPQTAGLADGVRRLGARVIWRCHVGRDVPDALSRAGWAFLRPYLAHVERLVFSRRVYAPDWVDDSRLVIIPPSIDPFSVKNMSLSSDEVASVLTTVGLLADDRPTGPVGFTRRNGTPGTVRAAGATGGLLLETFPPPRRVPLVVQVSRWDRLKDMAGVMTGFTRMVAMGLAGEAHLMLAGPEVAGVGDDPEGAEVLSECRELWSRLPADLRARVHLASLPMDDVDENAIIVNALQRHASVVVQKSLVEGFGLTVTEPMWKGRAVVASRVGGIQDQITHEVNGLLLDDPVDLALFANLMGRVLADEDLARRLGAAAHTRVLRDFVGDRHLARYVELFAGLVGDRDNPGHDESSAASPADSAPVR
ncbi:MAG TPA: glycosyltransferase [Microlunatus sp.]